MTAAKIMDVIARLPGCDGQAADAVSAYTQVKMEDAHKLLKIPESECPDIWIRLSRHKWPKSWSSMEDPAVLLERNLYGHPLAGPLWELQFQKVLEWWLSAGWEGAPPHFIAHTTRWRTGSKFRAFFSPSLPGPVVGEMPSAARYAAVGVVGRPLPHVVRDVLCEGG